MTKEEKLKKLIELNERLAEIQLIEPAAESADLALLTRLQSENDWDVIAGIVAEAKQIRRFTPLDAAEKENIELEITDLPRHPNR